ncbi:hypothetical protein AMTRI_Chr12g274650 [Amborella trichopoda]
MVGSSPRFPMYQNNFGWGRPLADRSGNANKYDGGGSIDVALSLTPKNMTALESDLEFLEAITGLGKLDQI